MMGLGGSGVGSGGFHERGNSSTSTSNLSASAPPFTVDRFNPKPSSTPLLGYQDSGYSVEPYSHGWQYAPPSAPRPELAVDSAGLSSRAVSDEYRFSNSGSVSPSAAHWAAHSPGVENASAFGGDVKGYYSPYVGEDTQLVEVDGPRYNVVPCSGMNVSYQTSGSQSFFDWDSAPGRMDGLGFSDGKRAKRVEPDAVFSSEKVNVGGSHIYKNQVKQEGHGIGYGNKSHVDSALPYEKFNHASNGLLHTGSLSFSHKEDNSCFEKDLSFSPYKSSATQIPASSSTYPDSRPLGLSSEMQMFSNYQIPYHPFDKRVDSPFPDPRSSKRTSPAVVIRPPPAAARNLKQHTVVCKPSQNENVVVGLRIDIDGSYPQKSLDLGIKQSTEIREDPFDVDLYNFSKQGNEQFYISSSLEKELSGPLHATDTFADKTKASFGSQSPDMHMSGALSCDSIQVGKAAEDSSDFTDHHSTILDSPCWKGAPFSQFSQVDIEADNPNHLQKTLGENLVETANEVNKEGEGAQRKNLALAIERTLDAISPSREQSTSGDAETGHRFGQGVQIINDLNMQGKGSGFGTKLKNGFDIKVSDTKHIASEKDIRMPLNDVAEGADIAFHAAENVLASPPSQEDATGHGKQQQELKLDGPTMIKAMHNLSKLLLCHLSNHSPSLEDDDAETLSSIISNLDACMSYKAKPTDKVDATYPVRNSIEKLDKSCDLNATSVRPPVSKRAEDSQVLPDYQHTHEQKRTYSLWGERAEKSPDCSPLVDELDIAGDDAMVKDVKKVLEENFHFPGEMDSQSLLFKSLWLEAEAKLCSISYKARFDRMKNEMEKIKPQENVDVVKLISTFGISPDSERASKLMSEAHDDTVPKPTLEDSSSNTTAGRYVDDVESSIMARFNILKSREENRTPAKTEEEEQHVMAGGVTDSVMSRFNILKSRDENLAPTNTEEEQQTEMVGGVANSVMSRFNILKSRENNLQLVFPEGELQSRATDVEPSAGKAQLVQCIKDQPKNEIINVALKPYFVHQAGSIREGEFGSFVDGSGYEAQKEHSSASFDSSRMKNEHYSGWRDSSSSDWEHVQKDDLVWKKL